MNQYVRTDEFRRLLDDGKEKEAREATLLKCCAIELGAGDGDKQTSDIIASTGDRDRYGDRVSPKGWNLKQFKKNPVILWSHDHSLPPVGRAEKIFIDSGKLVKRVEFTPEDLNPFGALIGKMVKAKFLNAASVGFNATKWQPTKASDGEDADELAQLFPFGLDFIKQELMESSIVTVPANPEAIVQARAAGIDTSPMAKVASMILDGEAGNSPVLSKAWYEQAYNDSIDKAVTVDLGASKPAADNAEPVASEEKSMSAREKVAEARDKLSEAKSAAKEMATEVQAAIVELCGEFESLLKDARDLDVELSEGTVERLKSHAHHVDKALPAKPEPPPAEEKTAEEPQADLADVEKYLETRMGEVMADTLAKHSGSLD